MIVVHYIHIITHICLSENRVSPFMWHPLHTCFLVFLGNVMSIPWFLPPIPILHAPINIVYKYHTICLLLCKTLHSLYPHDPWPSYHILIFCLGSSFKHLPSKNCMNRFPMGFPHHFPRCSPCFADESAGKIQQFFPNAMELLEPLGQQGGGAPVVL